MNQKEQEAAELAEITAEADAAEAAWAQEWAAMSAPEQAAHRERTANMRRKMQSSAGRHDDE